MRKYPSSYKAHWDSYGFGHKGDDVLWLGLSMPLNCEILQVKLEKLDKNGHRMGPTGREVGDSHSGARIIEDAVGGSSLRVKVHWWFDPGCIIRYRVIYTILQPHGTSCWPE